MIVWWFQKHDHLSLLLVHYFPPHSGLLTAANRHSLQLQELLELSDGKPHSVSVLKCGELAKQASNEPFLQMINCEGLLLQHCQMCSCTYIVQQVNAATCLVTFILSIGAWVFTWWDYPGRGTGWCYL